MKQLSKGGLAVLFLVIIYFPIFLHLDHFPINLWDESINALQALEMSDNGKFLRRHFLGSPDTWETKPPLLIWLQVLFIKLLGYTELAIRLPSAFAVLGSIFLMVRFFFKEFNFILAGIFSSFILLCSSGFVRLHVSRTGDHDALLIFFLIGGLLYYYKYLSHPEQRHKYFGIFTFFLIGGVMTKSIAGLYFAPALFLFTLIDKKVLDTLKWKGFYLGVSAFFMVIGSYYLLNEYYYPGYCKQVWDNELFPRFFNTATTYKYAEMPDPSYFTKGLFTDTFKYFALLLPLSLLLVYFQKDNLLKRFINLVSMTAVLFLFIISNGTFNNWYNAPVFPLLAILVGTGLGLIYRALKNHLNLDQNWKQVGLGGVFCLLFFFQPYKDIIVNECYLPKPLNHKSMYGGFLKKLKREQPEWKDLFVYYECLNRHFLFYSKVYNEKYGYNIRSCGPSSTILDCKLNKQAQVGDKVMICNPYFKTQFLQQFHASEIIHYEDCTLYQILRNND